MNAPRQRSVEIDFFRGMVLIVIALDHIAGSVLSRFTLHSWAVCDAAEVFVYLGGYASAAAFGALHARRDAAFASRRFVRRAAEIYRAYLFMAALMVGIGLLWRCLPLSVTPAYHLSEAETFLRRPLAMLGDVLGLRRQPYLASVLPMYACFALVTPWLVQGMRRAPYRTLGLSLLCWLAAPWLAGGLPSAYPEGWAFNPFAWQLMFVCGVLTRVHPVPCAAQTSAGGQALTRIAIVLGLGFAIWQLFLTPEPLPGYMKQNLSLVRVLDFLALALAWLAAQAVRLGWVRSLARRLPAVVTVGRNSLPCFVGGAVLSLFLEASLASLRTAGFAPLPGGLGADLVAIAAMLAIGALAERHRRAQAELRAAACLGPQRPRR